MQNHRLGSVTPTLQSSATFFIFERVRVSLNELRGGRSPPTLLHWVAALPRHSVDGSSLNAPTVALVLDEEHTKIRRSSPAVC